MGGYPILCRVNGLLFTRRHRAEYYGASEGTAESKEPAFIIYAAIGSCFFGRYELCRLREFHTALPNEEILWFFINNGGTQ